MPGFSGWAKSLSWKETAELFRTTRDPVFCPVERAVIRGCEHQGLSGVKAINILDRFHIMAHLNKVIDEVRAGEARELKEKGYEPVLRKTRWMGKS